jgi:hypothetical protein
MEIIDDVIMKISDDVTKHLVLNDDKIGQMEGDKEKKPRSEIKNEKRCRKRKCSLSNKNHSGSSASSNALATCKEPAPKKQTLKNIGKENHLDFSANLSLMMDKLNSDLLDDESIKVSNIPKSKRMKKRKIDEEKESSPPKHKQSKIDPIDDMTIKVDDMNIPKIFSKVSPFDGLSLKTEKVEFTVIFASTRMHML